MKEVSQIQLDSALPDATESISESEAVGSSKRLDHWWASVFATNKYPVLAKLVKACLSIFTGPRVEHSFSLMNDIINKKSNRMNIDTFSAIQTLKYDLKSKETTTLKLYRREDIHKTPVDKALVYHMHTAYGRYKRKAEAKSEEAKQKAKCLKLASVPKPKPKSVHSIAQDTVRKILTKNKTYRKRK